MRFRIETKHTDWELDFFAKTGETSVKEGKDGKPAGKKHKSNQLSGEQKKIHLFYFVLQKKERKVFRKRGQMPTLDQFYEQRLGKNWALNSYHLVNLIVQKKFDFM